MLGESGATGSITLQMKEGKDFFKESLKLITKNQPKETKSDDESATTDGE